MACDVDEQPANLGFRIMLSLSAQRQRLWLDPTKNGGITEHLRRTAINAHAHHYRSQRELHSTQGAGLHVNLGDCQPLKK